MPDLPTITCILEIVAVLLAAAGALYARHAAAIQRSLASAGETTRAARSQWWTILASFAGVNVGHILLVGTYLWSESANISPTEMSEFFVPASLVGYACFGIPIYLALAAVCGLLVHRYATRNYLSSTAGLVTAVAVSIGLGALVSIPVTFCGLLGAAV